MKNARKGNRMNVLWKSTSVEFTRIASAGLKSKSKGGYHSIFFGISKLCAILSTCPLPVLFSTCVFYVVVHIVFSVYNNHLELVVVTLRLTIKCENCRKKISLHFLWRLHRLLLKGRTERTEAVLVGGLGWFGHMDRNKLVWVALVVKPLGRVT